MSTEAAKALMDTMTQFNNLNASLYGTTYHLLIGDKLQLALGEQVIYTQHENGQMQNYLETQIRSMEVAAIEERYDQIRFEEIAPEQVNLMAIRLRPMTNMLLVMPNIGSSITKDLEPGDPAIPLLERVLAPAALFKQNEDGSAKAIIPAVMVAMLLSYYLR